MNDFIIIVLNGRERRPYYSNEIYFSCCIILRIIATLNAQLSIRPLKVSGQSLK